MKDTKLVTFERRGGSLLNPLGIAAIAFILIMGMLAAGYKNPRFLYLILPVMILLILPELAKKGLVSVRLDGTTGDITIVLDKWGRVYKKLVLPIASLDVSFKDELTSRAGKRKVLRLFHKKQLIASAEAVDGWETETLEQLATAINELKNQETQSDKK
jgi:hypothetical protein